MKLKSLFRPSPKSSSVEAIYGKIVGQARLPRFYTDYGVPDTVDGRFELVALHAFLVLRQLKHPADRDSDLGQALFDLMFEDMDLSLREMGAGDMGVGKRVKAMVQAFYGRIASYEAGLSEPDANLPDALARNVYGTVSPDPGVAAALADYVRGQDAHLSAVKRSDIESANFAFGDPA